MGTRLHWNLSIADEKLNALYNNAAFREAVSICVDRTEFAALFSDSWLEGGQAAPSDVRWATARNGARSGLNTTWPRPCSRKRAL